MFTLGIVGGVASGKSAAAGALVRRGAILVDADQVGHEILEDPEVMAAFRQRWGDSVVGPDGQIVRREVAKRVFGDDPMATREREFLNSVSHPRIGERLRERLDELQSQGVSLVVLDAALLFETGWDQLVDGVLFVDTPRDQRLQRALQRGWTPEQFAAREKSQWPVEQKRSRATWVIENSGSLEQLDAAVEKVWSRITAGERTK
jgi:dephospho-CoA kinase